ncbi:MAG: hypothetical protein LBK56_11385 [Gracilibacteraceae bacterium]|jgi:hypothetical protein|nr:hypothetical protein [Gracilibacteraceae bacterium]
MTDREFTRALRRGLGSAVVELKNAENKAARRSALLRCCLRDISYDWQSEGTKGYYLYTAIRALGGEDFFEKPLIGRFLSRCPDRLFLQLAAILSCYAGDGSEAAKEAFHVKYDCFAGKNGRFIRNSSVDEGFQWDEVVFQLFAIDGFSAFKRYAADAGGILLRNPGEPAIWDDWFTDRAEGVFGKKRVAVFINKASGRSDAVKALADALKAGADSRARYQPGRETMTLSGLIQAVREAATGEYPYYKTVGFRRSFITNASDTEISELARAALREEDETVKALLLDMFRRRSFPLDITPLLDCARSDNELLAEAAIDCLKGVKEKRIHDLAIFLLTKPSRANLSALALLEKNYKKSDDPLIFAAVKKSGVSHGVQQAIRDIYRRHRSSGALPALLRVYRDGECSYCRRGIVEAMRHCGVLPADILEECLHDSYDDTRKFAQRLLARGANRC